MNEQTPRLLLLTEDGSEQANAVIKSIARKLLARVDPECRTNLVEFEPRTVEQANARAASLWKSDGPETIRQVRALAAQLLLSEREFVLFHIDGDEVWGKQTQSLNVKQFESEFRTKVEAALNQFGGDRTGSALSRLIRLTPFFEMEAWLYQSTDDASAACQKSCRKHAALIASWKADRTLLDEVPDTKDICCLGSKHNEALAKEFPAAEVEAAGKSFAAAVAALRTLPPLMNALAATH